MAINEASLYDDLKQKVESISQDILRIKLTLNGDAYMGLEGLLDRVIRVKTMVDDLSKQDKDLRDQIQREKEEQKIWRISIIVLFVIFGLTAAAIVAILVLGGKP